MKLFLSSLFGVCTLKEIMVPGIPSGDNYTTDVELFPNLSDVVNFHGTCTQMSLVMSVRFFLGDD